MQCLENKTWSKAEPYCKIKRCQKLPMFFNGHYMNENGTRVRFGTSTLEYRTLLYISCSPGFDANIQTIICTASGTWDAEPKCSRVKCTFNPIPDGFYIKDGSNRKVTDVLFEESVMPRCNSDRFHLSTSGHSRRTCTSSGVLDGTDPICAPLCLVPDQIENGYYVDDYGMRRTHIPKGKTVVLKCMSGFTPSSSRSEITCLANHTWKGYGHDCVAKECDIADLPLHDNLLRISVNITSVVFNQTLTLQCEDGSEVVGGVTTVRCNERQEFEYEGDILRCRDKSPGSTDNTSKSLALIGGASGGSCAVIAAIVVVVIVILYRRRHSEKEPKSRINGKITERLGTIRLESENEYSNVNETETNFIQTPGNIYSTEVDQDADAADYYSFDIEKIPESGIKVENLTQFVTTADSSNERLNVQFESFKKGMISEYNAAMKTENRGKNKYREMYPYDHNRVVLQSGNLKSETDYINASYINGFSEPKHYIAAQAPLKQQKTINDFWRMVWQNNVSKIVMLTRLREEDKVKCDQYWPEKETEMFGRIQVTLQKTEQYSDFVIRHLLVSKDNCSARKLVQFHFTAWPDKGVPKYASSLVHFRQKAMKEQTDMKGPVIVHCSAGVGRTGTFIALDILTEQGSRLGYVDVYGCVQNLRKQRVLMVQTLEQYVFIHVALTEALMLSPSVLPASQFIQSYTEALRLDPRTRKRPIDTQFEMLQKLSPTTDECQYISAKEVQNRKKNRYANILPVDEYMPRLSDGRDYINAVFLPSYKTNNAFIITQSPLESTKGEFWRLVSEHRIHTIVMMNSVSELKSEEEIYWPQTDTPVQLDDLTITLLDEEEEVGHNVMTLEMNFKEKVRKIKLLQYCHQVENDFPGTAESILTLMELVQYWQQQTGNNPVLVHCMNGADKSGLFCVISAVIERLKIEQDVAISQTIEIMRNSREQMIISPEQFKFCHDVVLAYIKQFDTYSNFAEVHA